MSDDNNKIPNDTQHEKDLNPNGSHGELGSFSHKKQPSHAMQVWKGIGLLTLLHLLLFVFPVAFFFISIAQLVYLIPALIFFRNNRGIVQGLLIGAGITFLLNAACFGLLIGGNLNL